MAEKNHEKILQPKSRNDVVEMGIACLWRAVGGVTPQTSLDILPASNGRLQMVGPAAGATPRQPAGLALLEADVSVVVILDAAHESARTGRAVDF